MFYAGLTREQLLKAILISYMRDVARGLGTMADYVIAVGIFLLTTAEDAAFCIGMGARKTAECFCSLWADVSAWMEDVAAPALAKALDWLQTHIKGACRFLRRLGSIFLGLLFWGALTGLKSALQAKEAIGKSWSFRKELVDEWREGGE